MAKNALPVRHKKTTAQLVNNYGFALQSIHAMQTVTPYLPASKVVETWARFLLKAESLEESRWLVMGVPLIENFYSMKVNIWQPKALSYQLPGGKYTPDVLYIMENGLHVNVEVKGSTFQKGYKDARAKMRAAATLRWYHHFIMAIWQNGAWQLELIEPDKEYQTELQAMFADVRGMIENQGIRKDGEI